MSAVVAMALLACSRPVPLPTQPPIVMLGEALLEDATLAHDAACFWLEAGGDRFDAVWPHGFSALDNPPRIVDPELNVVAEVGSVYDVGGGLGANQASADTCSGLDSDWWVGDILPARESTPPASRIGLTGGTGECPLLSGHGVGLAVAVAV